MGKDRLARLLLIADRQGGRHCFYCHRPLLLENLPEPLFREPGFVLGLHGPVVDGVMFFRCTIDHGVPKCHGGADELDNLLLACPVCNVDKRNLTVHEYVNRRSAA